MDESLSTSVAAILVRRGREDRDALLDDLVALLTDTIPSVQVDRSLIRRRISAVRLPLGEHRYVLRRAANGSFEAARERHVRGVVISTTPMEIDAFLGELAIALDAELQRTEHGRAALRAWLGSENS